MSNILVLSEHEEGKISRATLCTVSAAKEIAALTGGKIDLLVVGDAVASAKDEAASIVGVAKVLVADAAQFRGSLAESVGDLLKELAKDYGYILAPSSSFGRGVLPRAAALCGSQPLSEVMKVEAVDTFVRPVYAGNVTVTVKLADAIKFMTIRATAYVPAAKGEAKATVEAVTNLPSPFANAEFVKREKAISARPDLAVANVVVTAGRGVGGKEGLAQAEALADKLNAALGATRAVVDAGLLSNDLQIGQTGKVVAPPLYIALGVSGAIQHLAGMRDAKVVVAVNRDAEAPIFANADYGLVADLNTALPEIIGAL